MRERIILCQINFKLNEIFNERQTNKTLVYMNPHAFQANTLHIIHQRCKHVVVVVIFPSRLPPPPSPFFTHFVLLEELRVGEYFKLLDFTYNLFD